ncbi:hypothetical protein [Nostoc sp.]|uniref:hypothetical protein n=1 Tax=Nostoc sp. TaxID=1180 RepID=UPI002FF90FB1
MQIGLFHQMWATPNIEDREFFAQTIADVQLAETLGFESCSFGEHHFNRYVEAHQLRRRFPRNCCCTT